MSLREPKTDESRLAAATWDLPKAQRYALRVDESEMQSTPDEVLI